MSKQNTHTQAAEKHFSSWWWAFLFTVLLVLWMASGVMASDTEATPANDADKKATQAPEIKPVKVRTKASTAESMVRYVTLYGRTSAIRAVDLTFRTNGEVIKTPVESGQIVQTDDVLVELSADDRPDRLAETQARVLLTSKVYKTYKKLYDRGHGTASEALARKTDMITAQQKRAAVSQEIEYTQLKAPFAGVLEKRHVELGSVVNSGQAAARLVQQSPFMAWGAVAETDVRFIKVGQQANILLSDGEELTGQVRYVSYEADEVTRTFRVEVEFANESGRISSGLSARINIPVQTLQTHKVSSALLALGDAGELGIKTVAADKVKFWPANMVKSEGGSTWLEGLPQSLVIISVGQGFVRDGDVVEAVPEEAAK